MSVLGISNSNLRIAGSAVAGAIAYSAVKPQAGQKFSVSSLLPSPNKDTVMNYYLPASVSLIGLLNPSVGTPKQRTLLLAGYLVYQGALQVFKFKNYRGVNGIVYGVLPLAAGLALLKTTGTVPLPLPA